MLVDVYAGSPSSSNRQDGTRYTFDIVIVVQIGSERCKIVVCSTDSIETMETVVQAIAERIVK